MTGVGVTAGTLPDSAMVTGALMACLVDCGVVTDVLMACLVDCGVVTDALMACVTVMGAPLSREENQVLADAAAGGNSQTK